MNHFLTIVLRNQFNLFYRFGYTVIPKAGLIEFDGTINDEIKGNIIRQFANVTPFEYDEEYLILHFEKLINENDNFVEFEIHELVNIYPLSQQARTSIESKIDQRIRLERPIFETELSAIETEIENKEVKKAISALWKICKFETSLDKYISDIGLENIFNGLEFRKRGTKANKIQNGNYWEYLIAYDRFDYFPNSTLGYFYDAGQVFAFNKGLPSFEGSGTHKFLENLNSKYPTIKFLDIIKYFETEEQLKGYVSQTTKGDIKQYIVAPLYLMLRDEIRKSDDISQTKLFKNLDYLKGFGDSFYYSVVLLGAFFGFRKFYDPYYEVLNLRFYKNFKAQKKQGEKEEQQENLGIVSNTDELVKPGIEEEKHTETKNEDEVSKKTISEVQAIDDKTEIQAEVKLTGLKVEEISNSSNIQEEDKKEVISDLASQYQKIIEQALDKYTEIKLSDIATMIKEQTGNKVQNGIVENVAKQLSGIEIIKIGQAKGIKRTTGLLFN